METTEVQTPKTIMTQFIEAKKAMMEALGDAQELIWEKLNERRDSIESRFGKDGKAEISFPTQKYAKQYNVGKGKAQDNMNRQLFRWAGISISEGGETREYLIDLFYNEIGSNNFHSQIGHFQFAALRPVTGKKGGQSPHIERTDLEAAYAENLFKLFQFDSDRLRDSYQSLSRYSGSTMTLEAFDPDKLVDAFLQFVDEKEYEA